MNYTVGIDLGGTVIKIGLLQSGNLIGQKNIEAYAGAGLKNQLPPIVSSIDELLNSAQVLPTQVSGLGFAFAGLVDSDEQRILSTNKKYDDGPEIDLLAWAREQWGWPLFALNDARMALLGEWQYGAAKGYSDVVLMTLGTGIGSAVLINNELLIGKHFQAGNLGGHLVINHRGSRCKCGNYGCAEAEASSWRLPDLIRSHAKFTESHLFAAPSLDFKSLLHWVAGGDEVALDIYHHCLSAWSAVLVSLVHAYDPQVIVLSGGIMHGAHLLLPVLQTNLNQRAWTPWGKVQLLQAKHVDSAALYGADYLVRSKII